MCLELGKGSLDKVFGKDLTEEVAAEQNAEWWGGGSHWVAEIIRGGRLCKGKGLEAVVTVWVFEWTERRLRCLKRNEQEEWLDEKRLRRHPSGRLAEPVGCSKEFGKLLKETRGVTGANSPLWKITGCPIEYGGVEERQSESKKTGLRGYLIIQVRGD